MGDPGYRGPEDRGRGRVAALALQIGDADLQPRDAVGQLLDPALRRREACREGLLRPASTRLLGLPGDRRASESALESRVEPGDLLAEASKVRL
jgi:hypothetical protein